MGERGIVTAAEIMARVEAAGGDEAILRGARLTSNGARLRLAPPPRPVVGTRTHVHSRQRWEKWNDCSGCLAAARAYHHAAYKRRQDRHRIARELAQNAGESA